MLELLSQTEELIRDAKQDLKLSPEIFVNGCPGLTQLDSPVSRQKRSFIFNKSEHICNW
jgi:hypothetical protein